MCAFCDIAVGDAAAHVVYEDEFCIAFLDHRPLFPGHTLLIPREHHQTIGTLPVELVEPLFRGVRTLSVAVEDAMKAEGTFIAINNKVSQSVPHLHVHVVPRRRKDGLRGFFWPRRPYRSVGAMDAAAAAIRDAVDRATV